MRTHCGVIVQSFVSPPLIIPGDLFQEPARLYCRVRVHAQMRQAHEKAAERPVPTQRRYVRTYLVVRIRTCTCMRVERDGARDAAVSSAV